ncbi:MAG TPA: hypothetical protein GXX29_02910 [Firmicutes bacterium]|nr:hypothetical protein [Bacillota bacterium]
MCTRSGFQPDDPTYDSLRELINTVWDIKKTWSSRIVTPYLISIRTESYSSEFSRRVFTLHTPAGDLEATYLFSLTGKPGIAETYYIKTREDAEKYLSLPIREFSSDVSSFFEADRQVGERGIVEVSLGTNPAGYVVELMGAETFATLSVTDRDIIHALCEKRLQEIIAHLKNLLAAGVGPFFTMQGEEYILPPLYSPRDFYDFNVRYDKPIIDLVHNGGGRIHIHCPGSIKKVFQGFLDMGVDVLYPVEPPPLGDITAEEAATLAGGKLCIEGNVPIAHLYEHTPEQIRTEVTALIKDAFRDGRGLIVSPTAAPYIRGGGLKCLPQYEAMTEVVLSSAVN